MTSRRFRKMVLIFVFLSIKSISWAADRTQNIQVIPPTPSSSDNIYIVIYGRKVGGCEPSDPWESAVSLNGKEIVIDLRTPPESDQVKCQAVGTNALPEIVPVWKTTGLLAPGEYHVQVSLNGAQPWGQTRFLIASNPEIDRVGGSAMGLETKRVICRNLRRGKRIVLIGDRMSWNCAESGLDVRDGDRIEQTIIGKARSTTP